MGLVVFSLNSYKNIVLVVSALNNFADLGKCRDFIALLSPGLFVVVCVSD